MDSGNSISYSEHNESNYNFLIIEGINSDGYTFKVSPMLCYAFKDNLAAGGRFSYARTLTKLSGVTINVDDDNQFDLDDMYQLKHSYAAMAMMRSYISPGKQQALRTLLRHTAANGWQPVQGGQRYGRRRYGDLFHFNRSQHRRSSGNGCIHQQLYGSRGQRRRIGFRL